MRKLIFLLLFLNLPLFAQANSAGAKGIFMAVGVGPRFPIGDFSDRRNIGIGADITLSYVDNNFIPFFLYTSIGYQHYPGREDFYKQSDYSSFSTNAVVIAPGLRYYFKPLLDNIVLLMPVIDAGAEYCYYEDLNQFKLSTGKSNKIDDYSKFGFHIGAGVSMFLLDAITYYNYLPQHQYISFSLKANIPIFITM